MHENETIDIYLFNQGEINPANDYSKLKNILNKTYTKKNSAMDVLQARLQDLNPQAILARGYSITRFPSGTIVRSAADVAIGQSLQVMLHKGHLGVTVDTQATAKPDE